MKPKTGSWGKKISRNLWASSQADLKKMERTQIINISNKIRAITTGPMDFKMKIKKYCEEHYTSSEMDKLRDTLCQNFYKPQTI